MKKNTQAEPIPLDDIAEQLQHVRWHGHYISALCPYHEDVSHPSLMVYEDGFFKCFTCGVYGSHQRLAAKLGRTHSPKKPEKPQAIPSWNRWLDQYGSWKAAADVAYQNAKGFPGLVSYISKRGMKKYLDKARIGWLDGWYSFPVLNSHNRMVDWVVRSDPRKNTDVKYATRPRTRSGESHLYCPDWELVEDNQSELYIPFGILDSWSLYACGYPALTSITGQLIKAELLDEFRRIIYIIPDDGEERAARRLRENLGWRGRILELDYPDGTKDCNDILNKHGIKFLTELIEESKQCRTGKITRKLSLAAAPMAAKT